jgi:hypothetical protein
MVLEAGTRKTLEIRVVRQSEHAAPVAAQHVAWRLRQRIPQTDGVIE